MLTLLYSQEVVAYYGMVSKFYVCDLHVPTKSIGSAIFMEGYYNYYDIKGGYLSHSFSRWSKHKRVHPPWISNIPPVKLTNIISRHRQNAGPTSTTLAQRCVIVLILAYIHRVPCRSPSGSGSPHERCWLGLSGFINNQQHPNQLCYSCNGYEGDIPANTRRWTNADSMLS